jgi:hypothetical protein
MGLKGFDDYRPPEGAKVLQIRPEGEPPPEPEPPQTLKYRNKPEVYNGVRYDSQAEADYARKLDFEASCLPGMWWIGQPTFRLGVPENVYRPDFLVYRPDLIDSVFAIDVKGVETPKFRRDLKLWKAYGPCRLCIVTRSGKGWQCEIIPRGGEE